MMCWTVPGQGRHLGGSPSESWRKLRRDQRAVF
jgi:hypothetical protein